ncbi:MAG: ATP-binding protein [Chromatiales bacterium]|jgi:PAS domain S-box-containing protein
MARHPGSERPEAIVPDHARPCAADSQPSRAEALPGRVIESIDTGIACFDGEGRCVIANGCFAEMLAVDVSALPGVALADLLSAQPGVDEQALLGECRAGRAAGFTLDIPRGGEEPVGLSGTLVPLKAAGTEVEGVVCTLVDVTEQRRADRRREGVEAALRESEKRLKEAQRIASIGSWDLDLRTRGLTWSDEVYRVFEADPESFRARYRDFLAIVHPDDREDVDSKLFAAVRDGTPFVTVHRLLMSDGRVKFVQERAEVLYSDEGEALRAVGTVQDVTDRRRLEDRMQKNQASLERAGRINTLGEMASTIAHELNQPLMAIGNYAGGAIERLRRKEGGDPKLLYALERIAEVSERAADIVKWIRAFVGERSFQKQVLDLRAVVKESLLMARPEARRNDILIRESLETDLPPVNGEPVNLQQVIVNLVLNAVDASGETPPDLREILVSMRRSGPDAVEISVADHGGGLDPEAREQLFQPFFTTKPGGIGLGLSIARTIVEKHGGELSAHANRPRGTVFIMRLPVVGGDGS